MKESGNEAFRLGRKRWSDAVQYYTNALDAGPTNEALKATILGNRAHVNLQLGNLGRALSDCQAALEITPSNVKILYRAAQACSRLGRYKSSMEYALSALRIDPKSEKVRALFNLTRDALASERRKRAEKQARAEEERSRRAKLQAACASRNLRMVGDEGDDTDGEEEEGGPSALRPMGMDEFQPYVDADDVLHWPVMLLYLEHHTSDTVRDWDERVTFREQLQQMTGADWDTSGHYRNVDDWRVHYRKNETSEALIPVPLDATLADVLARPSYTIYHEMPTFLVTSAASRDFYAEQVRPFEET